MIVEDPRPPERPELVDLTTREAVEELRRGEASEFYQDFEADPHVPADCPNCGQIPVGVSGCCEWGCGYDFMTVASIPVEDNRKALQ